MPPRLYQRDSVPGMVPLMLVRVLGHYLQAQGVDPHDVLPRDLRLDESDHLGRFAAED